MGSFKLSNPVGLILREIADQRMNRRDVAITYALVMQHYFRAEAVSKIERSKRPVDPFERINAAILGRWKVSGLEWLKERAWKIVGGKNQVGQAGIYARRIAQPGEGR